MSSRFPIRSLRLVSGLALAALAGLGMPALAQTDTGAREVRLPAASVAKAETRRLTATIPVDGSIVARENVSVIPQISGYRIEDVRADLGDRVEAGQVLVQLDRRPLEASLAQDDAAIAAGRAAVQQATSEIAGRQATLDQARRILDRAERLVQGGTGAQSTLDDARSQYASAEATLKAAEDAKANAEALLVQAEAKRRDTALQLERTAVRAPVAGIVLTRAADLGQIAATSGDPLFTLVRDGLTEFQGAAIETALVSLKTGQSAEIFPSGTSRRTGTVRLVSPRVDVATRQGIVKIAIDDPQGLPIGVFARASVEIDTREGVTVPLSAVMFDADGAKIQVVDSGGVIHERVVRAGILDGGRMEIREGLALGETVVAKAAPFFREGMRIRPVPMEEAPAGPSPVAARDAGVEAAAR